MRARRLVVGLALLAGGVVGLGALATSPWGEARLAALVQRQVHALLSPGWTLSRPGLSFGWDGRVVLTDVVLTDTTGRPAISVRRLDLDLAFPELPWRAVHVRALRLDGVRVRLASDADGVLDLVRAFGGPWPADPAAAPWQGLPVGIAGHDVQARDVELVIERRDAAGAVTVPLALTLAGLRGAVDLPRARPEVGVAGLDAHGLLLAPGPAGFHLGGDARWLGEAVEVGALRLQVLGSAAEVDARVGGLGTAPMVDATLRLDALDLATVRDLFGAPIEGRFGGVLTASGPLTGLALHGALAGVDGTPGSLTVQPGTVLCLPDGREQLVDACGPPAAPRPAPADAPLRWVADLLLTDVAVERIAPAVGGPLVLQGHVVARGGGTAWPDGVVVEQGRWDGEELDAYGVRVRKLGAGITLGGGTLRFDDLDLAGVAGTVRGQGSLDLVDGDLALDLHGELVPSMLEDFGVTELGGRGRWSGTLRGDVYADGVPIDIAAHASMAPVTWEDGVRVATVAGPLRGRVRDGVVDVTADLFAEGIDAYGVTMDAASAPDVAVHVEGTDVRVTGTVFGPVARYGDLARVEEPAAEVVIRVPEVGDPEVDVDLDVGAQDLLGLLGTDGTGSARLRGRALDLGVDLRWEGTPFLVTEGLTLDIDTLTFRMAGLDFRPTARQAWTLDGPATVRLVDGGVADADLTLRSDLGRLEVRGRLGTQGPLDGVVRTEALDLEALAEMFPDVFVGLDGVVDLELTAHGTAARPDVQATLRAQRLFWEDRLRYLDVDGRFGIAGDRFLVDARTRVGGAEWLELEGFVPIHPDLAAPGVRTEGAADLRVVLAPGGLDRFAHAVPGLELPEGSASAVLALSGPLRDPRLDLDGVAEVELEGLDAPLRVEADVVREAGTLVAHVDLLDGYAPAIALDGRATTRIGAVVDWILAGGPAPDFTDASLYADDLDLLARVTRLSLPTVRRLLGVDVDLTGAVDGTVAVTGSPRRPSVRAGLTTDALAAGERLPVALDVMPVDGGYAVDLLVGEPEAPWARVEGRVPLAIDTTTSWTTWGTGALALNASGTGVPLTVLRAIDPALEVDRGVLVAEGAITGDLDDPSPDLTLRLDGVVARYRPLGLIVRRADGLVRVIHAGPDRVRVGLEGVRAETRPLSGTLGQLAQGGPSEILVEGSVDLEGATPTAVRGRVALDGAWLSATPEQVLRASGELAVAGTWPEVAVGGRVDVDQGSFELNTGDLLQDRSASLDPSIVVHREGREGLRATRPEPPVWARGLDVGVGVGLGRNTQLRLKVPIFEDLGAVGAQVTRASIEARLGGDVEVGMRGGELSLVGEVETLDGRVKILQGEFDLGEGSRVSFLGRDYANPALDIAGSMAVAGGEVRLSLSGSALAPRFTFASDDFGSDAAILTILLTGQAPDELSASQGEAALQAASKLLVTGLMGGVSLGSVGVEPDGTIRFGLPLYRTLFLETTYRPTAGLQENTITVDAEWSILPRLVLDASYGDRRVSGNLAYELRFTGPCDRARSLLVPELGRAAAEVAPCGQARAALRAWRAEERVKSGADEPM